jgi:MinD-like ATPase involved in chromosome partitioning or flagellar assembly
MLISFLSDRHGQGKTMCTINIAAMLHKKTKTDKILIVDLNSAQPDIEKYLSNTDYTKGLDEFCNLLRLGMLNKENFENSIKKVHKRLYIMGSNSIYNEESVRIKKEEIPELKKYAERIFDYILFDTDSLSSDITEEVIKNSDRNVFVERPVLKVFEKEHIRNKRFNNIYIINMTDKNFKSESIFPNKKEYKEMKNSVFYLPYDPEIINELNENSILNYILGMRINNEYLKNLEKITEKIIFDSTDMKDIDSMHKTERFFKYKAKPESSVT